MHLQEDCSIDLQRGNLSAMPLNKGNLKTSSNEQF
jgi:hypothetical protein